MESLTAETVAGFGADDPFGEGPSAIASPAAVGDMATEEEAEEGGGAMQAPAAATGNQRTAHHRRNNRGDRYEKRFLQNAAAFGNYRRVSCCTLLGLRHSDVGV